MTREGWKESRGEGGIEEQGTEEKGLGPFQILEHGYAYDASVLIVSPTLSVDVMRKNTRFAARRGMVYRRRVQNQCARNSMVLQTYSYRNAVSTDSCRTE